MEGFTATSSSVKQTPTRKFSPSISPKDLWLASRNGSLSEVDSVLSSLKKNGGNIDSRNAAGLTPLHIAIWRNHVPVVKRLLAAGADPDARDGESGWSGLHRALHFGHIAVASVLMQAGASLTVEDSKCRIPVDLLSGPVSLVVGDKVDSVATEVYSWGSGTNYQLGTGNAHIQKLPGKVDALHDSYIKIVAASKFHSIAVGSSGELYTWGFGRGGRLGHPDFDVHSGQVAVITPRLVNLGPGPRRVKVVAAAKHHTVIATESGEVFTWGSNREGQLGYTSVDTQPTPRRVSCLRARIVAVAAANKHTVAVADSGEVFTWGFNKEGQLGYGTSNSASNYTPRMVECLKGKVFKGVSAAKYHTIVLSADGEVFTWGHRLVNPRRVNILRNLKKCGFIPLKFHHMERLHVTSIAAGMAHSSALTDDGALFYWISSDPDLSCQQLYSLCERNIVSISAGKYWTAAVTTQGDVYMWDGKNCKNALPVVTRLPGIKRATSVCVGETHLLAVCALYHPPYRRTLDSEHQPSILKDTEGLDDLDEELLFNDMQRDVSVPVTHKKIEGYKPVPTLKSLCEKFAAEFLVEPRNALQLLEIADSLEAEDLRKHCEDLVVRNLDYIFTVSPSSIGSASLELLAKLEKLLDARSSEPWSYRHLPTLTATFPVVIYSEEDGDNEIGNPMPRDDKRKPTPKNHGDFLIESFLQRESATDQTISKQVRALRKKLQQIEMLESKQLCGHSLDDQQIAKLQSRSTLEDALAELGFPVVAGHKMTSPGLTDGKGNRKVDNSKKQRRKSKQKVAQPEAATMSYDTCEENNPIKHFPDEKSFSEGTQQKDLIEPTSQSKIVEDYFPISSNVNHNSSNGKSLGPNSSKRRNKKGGLSMFLSGALDDSPIIPPPPSPKCDGPAWGGVKITKGSTSLRDIQNEQRKTNEANIKPKEPQGFDSIEAASFGQVRLGPFLHKEASSPIKVKPSLGVSTPEEEKSTPWSSSGTSPILHRPSLRDIQLQQEKKQQNTSHSPKTGTSGFAVPHGSPSESSGPVPSRWFKPENEAPSSIRSIQIEEKAIKEFKRFYSNVKLVKPLPQPL
ncbi:Ultraviolet-B receptor UVR8 [Apostasia shenzhenica]|uniref:Ultraviolet-B receptor UVR8 n=1 Tax=Apostasia shenzhenica TaxID=1088818 RepID=A0A2I0BE53_9ASPA|nr:Ultraviolet-B receptor UVR8 [Apostasia shenzhenica]